MSAVRRIKAFSVLIAAGVASVTLLAGVPWMPAAASDSLPTATGAAWPLPASTPSGRQLAPLGYPAPSGGAVRTRQAALALARRSHRPVPVTSLTSPTTTVTANPQGGLAVREYVLPVRVRRGPRWVAVSTKLGAGGSGWSPAAVPADRVVFSAGGRGPLARITAGRMRLALGWPGTLPAPVVAGSSATYREVLPGVDLVLTATSAAAGGFAETLVLHSAAAARDPGLAVLAQTVSAAGTRLRPGAGGGLIARAADGQGYVTAAEPQMRDSSTPPRVAPAPAQVSGGGQRLRLRLDTKLLGSPGTKFPVVVSESLHYYPAIGKEQAFDPIQSDCDSPHTDDTTDYPDTPVGYDNFQQGKCQDKSTDYSDYQVAVPDVISGPGVHLQSATIQAFEAYSSSCTASATVTLSWIGGINGGTDWSHQPGPTAENHLVTDDVKPDRHSSTVYSCGGTSVENNGVLTAAPFNVLPDIGDLQGKASSFTFRLWEPGNTNEQDHKQFTDNPDLQVTYSQAPSVPGSLKATADNDGTGSVGCDTGYSGAGSAQPPAIGKSASLNGPYLWATYNDPDGDSVQGTVSYWQYSDPSNSGTASAGSGLATGGTPVAAQMAASFTAGLGNGTVVAWKAEATDGPYTSAWSPTCYFTVYPNDPDPPAMTAGFNQSVAQRIGTTVSFTITQSGTDADPAREFVWGLDEPPPTGGTIPPAQTCTTGAATSSCSQITGGSATLTIPVLSPGPHDLWVYELDTAGNESAMTNDAPEGDTSTFTGAGDRRVDYTKGASLAANFVAARSVHGNSLISASGATDCGAASGDGTGTNIDATDLADAGWQPGKNVTIDGTNFTLPGFGTCKSDNLLAANQEIGTGSQGTQGSALVFLATSTGSYAQVPGLFSGSPDSGPLVDDFTAPAVPGGTAVSGSGCSGAVAFDISQVGCVPASGRVNYAAGCPLRNTPYALTVPDWQAGPSDIAAVSVPQVVGPGGVQGKTAQIYAFAVPIDPSCTVTSVLLPDVGNAVSATVAGSGATAVTEAMPGLHIFGMAVRDTSTASPETDGSAVTAPAGQAWTGAFAAPVEDAFGAPSGTTWGDQTVRIAVSPGLSAPAGAQIRIRLSDPGFLSGDGTGPLHVGAATIAPATHVPGAARSKPVVLAFGGQKSGTIPEGGDVYCDPKALPFAVTAGQDLVVSLWLTNSSLPELPEQSWASGAQSWFAPPTVPNETTSISAAPFTGPGSSQAGASVVLTGIDITTPETTIGSVTSPGAPTVVVAGDNVIDGGTSQALPDAGNAPSQRLAGQLVSQDLATGYGVVDAGIEANQVMSDGTATGGVSLLARMDRDILALPDVGTVILDEGLEDLLQDGAGTTATPESQAAFALADAYQMLEGQLNAFGINVIVSTLTPCDGYQNSTLGDSCTAGSSTSVDPTRQDVNTTIEATAAPNCYANLDAAVGNGLSPEALKSPYNAGDDVNLTLGGAKSGYGVLAPAVFSGDDCSLLPASYPPVSPTP
jgi:hypothetical protein